MASIESARDSGQEASRVPSSTSPASESGRRGWGGTFSALAERDYAVYFVGNLSFFLAMQMDQLLRGLFALRITDGAWALGVVSVANALPMLIVAPFGGVIADRYSKKKLLLWTQGFIATINVLFTVLIFLDLVEFWHLLLGAFLQGITFSVAMPVRNALVPQLIPRHKLMNAVSLQMGGMNLTRIIGPALAGLLVAPLGIGAVWGIEAALFATATLSILPLPSHGMTGRAGGGEAMLGQLAGGFRYIGRAPLIRVLLLSALVMPLFAFPVQLVLPVFAIKVYDMDSGALGILMAFAGIGGLIGALLTASLDSVPHKGRIMLIGALLQGGAFIAFALTPYFPVALVLLAAGNVGGMLFMTTNNSVIQTRVPEEFRGRVMAVLMMSFGVMPLGVLPMTLAADAIGAPAAVVISSTLMILTLAAFFISSSQLRTLQVTPGRRAELSPAQAAALVAEGKITEEEAAQLTGLAEAPAAGDA
ncbi:MAG: MFS transporter [Dehalococcoidia bacterium]